MMCRLRKLSQDTYPAAAVSNQVSGYGWWMVVLVVSGFLLLHNLLHYRCEWWRST